MDSVKCEGAKKEVASINLRFLSLRVLPNTSSNRIRHEDFIVMYVELATLKEKHSFIYSLIKNSL